MWVIKPVVGLRDEIADDVVPSPSSALEAATTASTSAALRALVETLDERAQRLHDEFAATGVHSRLAALLLEEVVSPGALTPAERRAAAIAASLPTGAPGPYLAAELREVRRNATDVLVQCSGAVARAADAAKAVAGPLAAVCTAAWAEVHGAAPAGLDAAVATLAGAHSRLVQAATAAAAATAGTCTALQSLAAAAQASSRRLAIAAAAANNNSSSDGASDATAALLPLLRRMEHASGCGVRFSTEVNAAAVAVRAVQTGFSRHRAASPPYGVPTSSLDAAVCTARLCALATQWARAEGEWRMWATQLAGCATLLEDAKRALLRELSGDASLTMDLATTLSKQLAAGAVTGRSLAQQLLDAREKRSAAVEHVARIAALTFSPPSEKGAQGEQVRCTAAIVAGALLPGGGGAPPHATGAGSAWPPPRLSADDAVPLDTAPPAPPTAQTAPSSGANGDGFLSPAAQVLCACRACAAQQHALLVHLHLSCVPCEDESRSPAAASPPPSSPFLSMLAAVEQVASDTLLGFRLEPRGTLPQHLLPAAEQLAMELFAVELHRRALSHSACLEALALFPLRGACTDGSGAAVYPLPAPAVCVLLAAYALTARDLPTFVGDDPLMWPAAVKALAERERSSWPWSRVEAALLKSAPALESARLFPSHGRGTVGRITQSRTATNAATRVGAEEVNFLAPVEAAGAADAAALGISINDVGAALGAGALEALLRVEATRWTCLGDAFAALAAARCIAQAEAAVALRVATLQSQRRGFVAAHPAGAAVEAARLRSGSSSLAAIKAQLREALPAFMGTCAVRTAARAPVLSCAQELLSHAPLGAVTFAEPALAPLHALASSLASSESLAAELSRHVLRTASALVGVPSFSVTSVNAMAEVLDRSSVKPTRVGATNTSPGSAIPQSPLHAIE